MSAFRKFEDILAWQKARSLTSPSARRLSSEILRKISSFGARSVERPFLLWRTLPKVSGRHSDKDFANFLNIAHGSAYEVQSHLYVALDLEYIDPAVFQVLYDSLDEISRMLFALRKRLVNG
jgi:23S rRNA-intervening sequence protein